jgi:hypothetical protein
MDNRPAALSDCDLRQIMDAATSVPYPERRQWLADIFVRPLRRRAECPPGGVQRKKCIALR